MYKENLIVWISDSKFDEFYHSVFSDYGCHLYYSCYINYVSADVFFRFLLVILVEFGSQRWTLNHILYLIHWGRLFGFR